MKRMSSPLKWCGYDQRKYTARDTGHRHLFFLCHVAGAVLWCVYTERTGDGCGHGGRVFAAAVV